MNAFKRIYQIVQKKVLNKVPKFKKDTPRARKYKDDQLEKSYVSLRQASETLNQAKKAKTKLLNRVFVTIISLPPNTSLRCIINEYLSLLPLYALRWRIENAFKALKSEFYIPCACTSSIHFLYLRTVAITLLNEYSYSRILQYRSKLRKKGLMWPEMTDEFHGQNYTIDPKIDAGLSCTEWKMAVFENQMKNWLQSVV